MECNNATSPWGQGLRSRSICPRGKEETLSYVDAANHTEMNGEWRDGMYWPSYYFGQQQQQQQFMRSITDRPALMKARSEVFWRANYDSGRDVDFVWDRHTENPSNESFVIHYVQGAWASYFEWGEWTPEDANAILRGKMPHPKKPREDGELQYQKFCSFLIRSDPNNLLIMFQRKNYDIEAIVRHIFFKRLSEYKPCSRLKNCYGNPYNSYKCFYGFTEPSFTLLWRTLSWMATSQRRYVRCVFFLDPVLPCPMTKDL